MVYQPTYIWGGPSCVFPVFSSRKKEITLGHSHGHPGADAALKKAPAENLKHGNPQKNKLKTHFPMLELLFHIWWFPEIGVPPDHPFIDGMFFYKPSSSWGTPMTMETSIFSHGIRQCFCISELHLSVASSKRQPSLKSLRSSPNQPGVCTPQTSSCQIKGTCTR